MRCIIVVFYWRFEKIRFLLHFCVLKKTILLLSTGSITTTGALCGYLAADIILLCMSIPSLSFYSYRSRARRSSLSRPFSKNRYTPKTGPLGYLVRGRSVPVWSTLLRLYYVVLMHVCVCMCVCVCKNNNKKIFSLHYCQSNRPHTAVDVPEHHCKHNWNAVSKNLFDYMCQVCAMAKGQGLVLCNYVKVRTGHFFSFCLCPHHPRAHAFTMFGIITTTNNTITATAIIWSIFFMRIPVQALLKYDLSPRVFFRVECCTYVHKIVFN